MAVSSNVFGAEICKAIGLSPKFVSGISLFVRVGESVKMQVDTIPNLEKLQVFLDDIASLDVLEITQDGELVASFDKRKV